MNFLLNPIAQSRTNMCSPQTKRTSTYATRCDKGIRKTGLTDEEYKVYVAKRQSAKVTCECGTLVSKVNLPAHKRSKKHFTMMKTGIWINNQGRKGEKYKTRVDIGQKRRTYNGVECLTKEELKRRRTALHKSTRTCVGCGTKVLYNSMWNHLRSPKHRDLMAKVKKPKHFIKKRKYKLVIVD
mgnify:CR=1 FL=1